MVQYRRFRTKNRYLYFLLAAITLLIFLYLGLFNFLLSFFIYPIQHQLVNFGNGFNQFVINSRQSQDLRVVNKELELQVSQMAIENTRLKVLEEENAILREALEFKEKNIPEREQLLGRVIGRTLENHSIIIIDKGAKDGIIPDLAAITRGGIMVGKVTKVTDSKSEVTLLTDTNSLVAGMILSANNVNNVVTGRFGLSLEVDLIPQTEKIELGHIVSSSGLEEHIPRGLLIGDVREVKNSSRELFQTAFVEPAVDYNTLTIVSIILPE